MSLEEIPDLLRRSRASREVREEPLIEVTIAVEKPEKKIPSTFPLKTYIMEDPSETYGRPKVRTPAPLEEADLVSSEVDDGGSLHTVVLDIDMPAALVPSTTPGHHHLYIDRPMTWRQYKKLLKALAKAGIIEPGYAAVSIKRGATQVRLPWIKKVLK